MTPLSNMWIMPWFVMFGLGTTAFLVSSDSICCTLVCNYDAKAGCSV